ncbi:peroxisome biogenesis factor 10-like isoform X2 [Drosophila pseudoobscura]|uniref:Peroxisome biogenesis factor 10-like isoform X2 n=1 Tax=Drosophila pseudoobscura pseudoobscura TaxID=46245 RepID=A0A6I8VQF5_DROPS|nr:peroxisome biogenesis factor 10 isoform X2 [Drosophila pseudoobscura]
MSDNINNNEQNRDMNDSQDVPNQANDLVAEEPINAEDLNPNDEAPNEAAGSTLQQPNYAAIVDYYLLNKNIPQRPIGMDINMTHKIETGTPITISFISGDVFSITTTSNQASISLRPPHDPGRVRVHINSLESTPPFPVDPWSCKPSGQFRCGICLIEINQLENIRSTTCGHIYCDSCLQQALRENGCCPICGNPQEYESSIRLFWCGHKP